MLALIEIPHQRKARLHWYVSRDTLIEAAISRAAESDRAVPGSVDAFHDAVHILADDWNGHILVENAEDVEMVARYTGHQQHVVGAMLDELRDEFFADLDEALA